MNDKPNIEVEKLKPFTKFIYTLGQLPSSYLASMSYEEQLIWLCNYLAQTVIPTVNNNGAAVTELQNLFTELQTYVNEYFDNLDVQEEINAKLDDMALDGTLTILIKGYVDPIYQTYESNINEEISDFKNEVNASISQQNTLINSITSGSPAGVYSTVSDLTSADPDHDKIYVVTADGKWYYYDTDSTSWVAGGTYQSTGIADNSITLSKLATNLQKDILDLGENLFKDPNNGGNLDYTIRQTSNATVELVDTPVAMTSATNTKALKFTTTAQSGYVRLVNFEKNITGITKVSFSANIYVETSGSAAIRFIFYNKSAGTLIKSTSSQQGNSFRVVLEDISITELSNLMIAIQGQNNPNVVAYITDLTLVSGETGSPYYIDYSYKPIVKSEINNKNLLIFGDSITSCCNITINQDDETSSYSWKNPSNSYINDQSQTINYSMWPRIIYDNYGCKEIRNYAKAGAHYHYNAGASDPLQNVSYQIEVAINDKNNPNNVFNQSTFNPDIVIFALGTNDSSNDTYSDAMNKSVYVTGTNDIDVAATLSNLRLTKFNEAMRYAFLKIKQEWPQAQLYVVIPIQRANSEASNVNEQIKEMALRYGAIIINGYGNSGITRELNFNNNLGVYLKDGLHPNDLGQNLLARLIIKSLESNYMDFKNFNNV